MKFSNYYQRSAIKSAPILPLSRENFIFNFIQLPHRALVREYMLGTEPGR